LEADKEQNNFQNGQAVRLVRLNKESLNGVEGTLGAWDGATNRWAFKTDTIAIKIKPTNLELTVRNKVTLVSAFLRTAVRFDYHNDLVNHRVFDLI